MHLTEEEIQKIAKEEFKHLDTNRFQKIKEIEQQLGRKLTNKEKQLVKSLSE